MLRSTLNGVPTTRNAALLDVSEAEQVFRVPRQAGFSGSGRAAKWPTSWTRFFQKTGVLRDVQEMLRASRNLARVLFRPLLLENLNEKAENSKKLPYSLWQL